MAQVTTPVTTLDRHQDGAIIKHPELTRFILDQLGKIPENDFYSFVAVLITENAGDLSLPDDIRNDIINGIGEHIENSTPPSSLTNSLNELIDDSEYDPDDPDDVKAFYSIIKSLYVISKTNHGVSKSNLIDAIVSFLNDSSSRTKDQAKIVALLNDLYKDLDR